MTGNSDSCDMLVVGGGINGVGIARDAAGRGLKVLLCERHDLASATSSASSKLIHGGLRYLEHGELSLVRESLAERETLLRAAPHIIQPLRFVLPVHPQLRPAWLLRGGLFLYDRLGGRKTLPPTRTLHRSSSDAFKPLKKMYHKAFEYSDCRVDDARLVVLNARDAAERDAEILIGWALTHAQRQGTHWIAELTSDSQTIRRMRARCIVNAAGPWVGEVIQSVETAASKQLLRLVQGSHIIVPKLYPGPQAYTFQTSDRRICFAIPFENEFTLIGTTDVPYDGDRRNISATSAEVRYLCDVASAYFQKAIVPHQVVWTYSGVRPLYDNGAVNASTVTRDYAFDMNAPGESAPLLSVFGGKLTTYRKLAEHALKVLQPLLAPMRAPWTHNAALPGGDFDHADFERFCVEQIRRYAWVASPLVRRLARAYGTRLESILGPGGKQALGERIAPDMYEAELDYLRAREWARCSQDVLWRRSKLGLHIDEASRARLARWFGETGPVVKRPVALRTDS